MGVGCARFITGVIVLVTGLALTRRDLINSMNVGLKNPDLRQIAYWAHVITSMLALWLYILHRLSGPKIKWGAGVKIGLVTAVATIAMVAFDSRHPPLRAAKSEEGQKCFEPIAAKTASRNFIPAETQMMDGYCLKCHEDAY